MRWEQKKPIEGAYCSPFVNPSRQTRAVDFATTGIAYWGFACIVNKVH